MLKTNVIKKQLAKSCKTGVILVIWTFTVLPCSSSGSNSSISITETTKKLENVQNVGKAWERGYQIAVLLKMHKQKSNLDNYYPSIIIL